jgi:hypothetical protein
MSPQTLPNILYSAVVRLRQQPSLLSLSSLSSHPHYLVFVVLPLRGFFHPRGRERMRNPEGRAYERFCTRPTTCEDFSDLRICSQLRICGFANLRIVGAKKKKKNRKFAIHNSQLWKSGTAYYSTDIATV